MTIPNTPAELIAANNQPPSTPYNRPAVQAVMDLLYKDPESNVGDFQAVAELCIDFLKEVVSNDLERHAEHCCAVKVIKEALHNLEAAEHFLEQVPLISMNDPECDDA